MATGAEDGRVELGRLDGGIIRVRGLRSVARFAIHMRVLAGGFLVEDIRMAGLAGLMARELNGPGRDFGHGTSPVVAVLSKTFRDQETPDDEECQEAEHEDPSQAEKMSCILEDIHGTMSATTHPGTASLKRAETDLPR
jgi:hypothetical protein